MKLPPHRQLTLDNSSHIAQVDWAGAEFAEMRLVLPLFRHSAREAALAHVLARLLPLANGETHAAHTERMLGRGASVSSVGGVDRISLSLTTPIEHCASVLNDALSGIASPIFSDNVVTEFIAGEQTKLRQAVTMRETRLHVLAGSHRWGADHPYARSVITDADLDGLTGDELTDYARRVLTMTGAAITTVGDFGTRHGQTWTGLPDDLADLLSQVSGPGDTPLAPRDPGPGGGVVETVVTTTSEPTASLRVAAAAPIRQHPDHAAIQLFSMCLGGYFGSRLVQELRERRGVVYGVTAGFEVLATAATQALMLECPAERIDEVTHTVRATLADLRDQGPGDVELQDAVRYTSHAATVGLAHPAALASASAAVVFGGDRLDHWRRQTEQFSQLTPDEVAHAGQMYAGASTLIELTARPESSPPPTG